MRRFWVIGIAAVVLSMSATAWAEGPGPTCVLIGLPGDANMDLKVDLDDFVIMKSMFGILPPPGPCWHHGDFDHDNLITLSDFAVLKQNFGLTYDWQNELPDLDCDGDVDLVDLDLGMEIYGEYVCDPCWPDEPAANVPEPAGISLLAIGAAALLRRRTA